jgi:thiamine-monophosphate kinase
MAPTLADLGERKAIAAVQEILGARGKEAAKLDDAAVVPGPSKPGAQVVATTDTLTYQLHRLPNTPLDLFGYYACAVSISDLAAMGARPRGMLIAVGLPPATAIGDLKDLALGFRRAADRLGFDVWGGDLKQAPHPHITTTAIGEVAKGRALRRGRGVKPGWIIGVTGFVGRAAMGARMAQRSESLGFELVYDLPSRVAEGRAAAATSTRIAAMDSSDGLSVVLSQLSQLNGIGFDVEPSALPVQPGLRKEMGVEEALNAALHWGGDFELVLCAPRDVFEALRKKFARMDTALTPIGVAVKGAELTLIKGGGRQALPVGGFEHFKTRPADAP